ncbi:MAG: hypothetical protein BGO29_06720 [Bacteroidales bacterium 36-12]|nr:MAG: hypothetical protein BGO29_06720 [Bacteroidales bacterium 36-12]
MSKDATISIVTASPYAKQLVSTFGHMAIRVNDAELGIDYIFNYGVFDSNLPLLSVLHGMFQIKLECELWVIPFEEYYSNTKSENRTIHEHVLNLSSEEKETMWKFLIEHAKGAGRLYYFDFFNENCTTYPRDLIGRVFNETLIYSKNLTFNSYRSTIHRYTEDNPWLKFTIDFITGAKIDKTAHSFYGLFTPQELEDIWMDSYIEYASEDTKALFKESVVLFERNELDENTSFRFTPLLLSLCLLALFGVFMIIELLRKKYYKSIDYVLFGFMGIVGLLFFLFKLMYSNWYFLPDWKLLWIHPFHLILVFIMWKNKPAKYLFAYHILNLTLLISLLAVFIFSIQYIDIAYLPIVLCMIIRSVHNIFMRKLYNKHQTC